MKLNPESVKGICGDSDQVVIFGFGKYHYESVFEAFKSIQGITPFNYTNWQMKEKPWAVDEWKGDRFYKGIITDLVFENYKRHQEGKPLIPLIFVMGADDNEYTWEDIASKADYLNEWSTHSELRRAYKLYTDINEEVQEIAKQTFKFVKLEKKTDDEYLFKQITPFWQEKGWEQVWQKRKDVSITEHGQEHKSEIWRNYLKSRINDYNSFFAKKNSPPDEQKPENPKSEEDSKNIEL